MDKNELNIDMKGEEIDCDYTKEIVCPYCGYEFGDSWEYNSQFDHSNYDIQCESCDAKFKCYMDVDVTYTSEKLKDEPKAEKLKDAEN